MATAPSVHDIFATRWYVLSKAAGLKLLRDKVDVDRCLDRHAIRISWTGHGGQRYSHIIHEVEMRPGGFRQDVVNEFKVKVMMSLA